MANLLRIGVIGLGRCWQRLYKPALRARADRFAISSVCDQVQLRADREARALGCSASPGPAALLERDDIDALLLIDPQWYGLWPFELACRRTTPVYCAPSLEWDDAQADSLCQLVQKSRLPVQVEMAPRSAPATERLQELLQSELGLPRLVLCEVVQAQHAGLKAPPVPAPEGAAAVLGGHGIPALDWCASVLGGEPIGVTAAGVEGLDFTAALLEFDGGRGAHIHYLRRPGGPTHWRLHVFAEKGSIEIQLPAKVRWTGPHGSHVHRLGSQRSPVQQQLERFADAICEGKEPTPNLHDAFRVLTWLRALRLSREQGKRVEIKSVTAPRDKTPPAGPDSPPPPPGR